jgi:tryptophan synthase alpha chain
MNRIRAYLKNNSNRKLLIPFFTAGFPDMTKSLEFINAAGDVGSDIIEIGMPFSDPLADGPEIQHSSYHSLKNGTKMKSIFKLVKSIRKKSDIPIVLMGYYNPVLNYGQDQFMKDVHTAGVDGLIIPDLPVDEAGQFKRSADKFNLSTVFLVAPTSPPDRVKRIDKLSSDFVYAVTVTGVTGSGKTFDQSTDNYLKKLRVQLHKKFVAGFGVSSSDSARRLALYSDGVVIGSKLISVCRQSKSQQQAVKSIAQLLSQIRKALG